MKKFAVLLVIAVLTVLFISLVYADAIVPETNLDGVQAHLENYETQEEQYILYGDGTREPFSGVENIGLFVNGSIVKNANLFTKDGRTMVPLQLISEILGAEVEQNSLSKVTVTDGSNTIELTIGNTNPTLNGNEIAIDAYPTIVDGHIYVPIRFIAESLGCTVEWFDGTGIQKGDGTGVPEAHYLLRIPQVMISRYPADAKAMSQSEAIEKVQEQLIIAYENLYNTQYEPLDAYEPDAIYSEKDSWRATIPNVYLTSGNDRFYTIHVVWEFMVDKYTGTVFTFYNGDIQMISKFDPYSSDALVFAG